MKPIKAHYDIQRQTSRLYFEAGKTVEVFMRGGVCWPIMVERSGQMDFEGCIILAGQDVQTKTVHILEQKTFATVENIMDDKQMISYHGIIEWLNKCWSRYFGRKFYYHQDDELTKKYRLEVSRCQAIQPKPSFVEIDWSDDEEARMLIWRYVKLQKIKFHTKEHGEGLSEELELTKRGDKRVFASVHALTCLLAALERHPWRVPP